MNYCCQNINYYINSKEDDLLEYSPDTRSYNFILHCNSKQSGLRQELYYCPWCGTELPKELDEEWGEALEKEYNLTTDDFWDEDGNWDESKIPEEFRTDEWWKKRGM